LQTPTLPPPFTRCAAQKEALRQKLLSAAKTRFDREGFHATTLRDIARDAGASTGALFLHWPHKEALYEEAYGHAPISPETGRILWSFLELKGHDPVNILRTVFQAEAA